MRRTRPESERMRIAYEYLDCDESLTEVAARVGVAPSAQ